MFILPDDVSIVMHVQSALYKWKFMSIRNRPEQDSTFIREIHFWNSVVRIGSVSV